ncbi:DUF7848 domain-containing protein [Actinacidiphila oryziradicis]|uniref:DUF7848 domain-containing protein n=1 Tax=Actinacidiphila oryziradicis TaxID=2571141 RepID=A0A4U0STW4_9ACTN|nr:hypothetical protein [Actinacidiphila oryziradicis]TKA13476.1 hypothetical protein FCI23_01960 [Actinacidiphila oryziradicis]
MDRKTYRYVSHTITAHPNTDVTYEAECLRCNWTDVQGDDSAPVDIACMEHTGRTGHEGFRRICTSFALVTRSE